MKIDTGQKDHSCYQCNKSFSEKGYLVKHMKSHTGQKDHSCDQCNKSFSLRSHLVTHMKTHTGQKDHACDRCNKRFSQRSNLVIHIKTHTGQKDHSCEQCNFLRDSNVVNLQQQGLVLVRGFFGCSYYKGRHMKVDVQTSICSFKRFLRKNRGKTTKYREYVSGA